jgi:hypothetical protein
MYDSGVCAIVLLLFFRLGPLPASHSPFLELTLTVIHEMSSKLTNMLRKEIGSEVSL